MIPSRSVLQKIHGRFDVVVCYPIGYIDQCERSIDQQQNHRGEEDEPRKNDQSIIAEKSAKYAKAYVESESEEKERDSYATPSKALYWKSVVCVQYTRW